MSAQRVRREPGPTIQELDHNFTMIRGVAHFEPNGQLMTATISQVFANPLHTDILEVFHCVEGPPLLTWLEICTN